MTTRLEIYKCNVCGNIVEVTHASEGTLSCCGQDMQLLTENTVDAAKEKHVPVVEDVDGGYRVRVGEVAHPMVDNHYIEWIELIDGSGTVVQRKHLEPGQAPEATFATDAKDVYAREYCTLHGNWRG
jgi:superoxide reductase